MSEPETIGFTFHVGVRMIDRFISVAEVEEALIDATEAEVIEDYRPGISVARSLLILVLYCGWEGFARTMHLSTQRITTYEPNFEEWKDLSHAIHPDRTPNGRREESGRGG